MNVNPSERTFNNHPDEFGSIAGTHNAKKSPIISHSKADEFDLDLSQSMSPNGKLDRHLEKIIN